MKVTLRKEVKNTYVGFNHIRGQQPPRNVYPRWPVDLSVFKVTSRINHVTKEMRKYQIKDKNERKQISGSTVTPALNAAQLTLWPH